MNLRHSLFGLLAMTTLALAQPANVPDLDFLPVPESFSLPTGMNFGAVSGVAINSKGNIFVLNRGPNPLMEFDADGKFLRWFGQGMFDRPHGLRIDAEDNIWATDVGSHVVYKFNPQGRLVMVLGVRGTAGEWHYHGHLREFTEPNDVAIGPNGDIFITQGHSKSEVSRVLKFDKDGKFVKQWGKKGAGPGEFDIPHSVVVDAKGLVYIADRNNKRLQVFDAEGTFVKEWVYFGTPCGLALGPDGIMYLANGHDGRILKLDMNGNILGMAGKQGKALGQFGEAHFLALSAKSELYVADTLNWRIQKYVKK
jgi:DNA-binding beta-propeller fold protein YncE